MRRVLTISFSRLTIKIILKFVTIMAAAEAQRIMTMSLGKIVASKNRRGGISLHRNLLVASVLFKARDAYLKEHSSIKVTSNKTSTVPATTTTTAMAEPKPMTVADDRLDNSGEMDTNDDQLVPASEEVSESQNEPCESNQQSTSDAADTSDDCANNDPTSLTSQEWNSEPDTEKENTPPTLECVGSSKIDSDKRVGLSSSRCRKRSHANSESSSVDLDSDKCSPTKSSKIEDSELLGTNVNQSSNNLSSVTDSVQSCHDDDKSSVSPPTKFRDNIFSTAYQTPAYASATSKNISCSNLLDSLPLPMLVIQVV